MGRLDEAFLEFEGDNDAGFGVGFAEQLEASGVSRDAALDKIMGGLGEVLVLCLPSDPFLEMWDGRFGHWGRSDSRGMYWAEVAAGVSVGVTSMVRPLRNVRVYPSRSSVVVGSSMSGAGAVGAGVGLLSWGSLLS